MLNWLTALPQELTPVAIALIVVWLATMMVLPSAESRWGERAQRIGINASVLLQAACVLALVVPVWGIGRAVTIAAIVAVLAWSAEFVGSHTGIPFGQYAYTDRLQPQLGKVPLLIPLAWLMMLLPSWAIGGAIAGSHRGLSFILTSALAFTAWDLFLDPQMVAWRLWAWSWTGKEPGRARGYFGIPWTNYAGWFVVSALITWVAHWALPSADTPWAALSLIYVLTWLMETVGQFAFWRLYGPATAGAFGMGLCLVGAIVVRGY